MIKNYEISPKWANVRVSIFVSKNLQLHMQGGNSDASTIHGLQKRIEEKTSFLGHVP